MKFVNFQKGTNKTSAIDSAIFEWFEASPKVQNKKSFYCSQQTFNKAIRPAERSQSQEIQRQQFTLSFWEGTPDTKRKSPGKSLEKERKGKKN